MDSSESDLARIKEELADSFDEELEMELDEARLEGLFDEMPGDRRLLDRRVYFQSLFKLQHEPVRLQDWVQHNGLKLVVLFDRWTSIAPLPAVQR